MEIGGSVETADRVCGRRVATLVVRGLTRTMAATAVLWLALSLFPGGGWDGLDASTIGDRIFGSDPTGPLTVEERLLAEERASRWTVTVTAVTCRGRTTGSGFEIDGMVLTNRHIVLDAVVAEAASAGGSRRLPATVPGGGADLAVLLGSSGSGATPASEPLQLASDRAPVGSPVVLAGRGAGNVRLLEAVVTGYTAGAPYGIAGEVMLLDRAVVPGWSGGPVVDRRGRVVGMLQAVETSTGVTLALPVDQLRSGTDSVRVALEHLDGVAWRSDPLHREETGCITTNEGQ